MQLGAGPRLVVAVDYGTTSTGQVPYIDTTVRWLTVVC